MIKEKFYLTYSVIRSPLSRIGEAGRYQVVNQHLSHITKTTYAHSFVMINLTIKSIAL